MKIVISDTGPIHYLIWIGRIELLHALYKNIIIPTTVLKELQHPNAPSTVQSWAQQTPSWLKVKKPGQLVPLLKLLDPGEHEALSLAVELNADLVIIDEQDGRTAASSLNLPFIGTIGIIITAVQQNVLTKNEAQEALMALSQTNKRIHPKLLSEAITIIHSL